MLSGSYSGGLLIFCCSFSQASTGAFAHKEVNWEDQGITQTGDALMCPNLR